MPSIIFRSHSKPLMQGLLQTVDESDPLNLLKSNPLFKMGQSPMMGHPSHDDSLGLLKTLPMLGKNSSPDENFLLRDSSNDEDICCSPDCDSSWAACNCAS